MESPPAVSGLVSCERVIAAAVCDSLVRELASASFGWEVAKVHAGTPESTVTTARQATVARADKDPRMASAVEAIDSFLMNHELVRGLCVERSPIGILNYGVGGRYTNHRDAGPAHPTRVLTLLTYLNDDFDGGGTRFTASGREVRPEAGMGVLFDAALAHSGEPVLHGRKYALVTWLRTVSIP